MSRTGAAAPAPVEVLVRRLPAAEGLPLPGFATAGASGADVCAAVRESVVLPPGERAAVPTGLEIAVPRGYEVQVRPRSGLALRHGVTVANAPGTIDSDYRGEIKLIVTNLGKEPYVIRRGARMAQMVIQEVVRAQIVEVEDLESTQRSSGGFGHTGV